MSETPGQSQSEPPRRAVCVRHLLKWCLVGIGVIAGTFVATCMAPGWIVGMRAHREQVAALLATDDDECRRRVTARLGAVLTPKDGSWIAISYRDDHTMPFAFSSTVARCSDGTWMESDYHFCGELSGYAKQRDMYREWMKAAATPEERENCRKMIEEAGSNTLLDEAEASASLAEAKAILQQMGLRPMRSPR